MDSIIEDLKEKYALTQQELDRIYETIYLENFHQYLANGEINFIIGLPGSGKSTFSTKLANDPQNRKVAINGDYIREFHPRCAELKTLYPNIYCYIVNNARTYWIERILLDVKRLRKSVNLEFSGRKLDRVTTRREEFSQIGYESSLYLLPVKRVELHLRILERFLNQIKDNGTGRINQTEMLNNCFENIHSFLKTSNLDLFDKIYIVGENQDVLEVSKKSNQIIDEMKNREDGNQESHMQDLIRLNKIQSLLVEYSNFINPVLNPIINSHVEKIHKLIKRSNTR